MIPRPIALHSFNIQHCPPIINDQVMSTYLITSRRLLTIRRPYLFCHRAVLTYLLQSTSTSPPTISPRHHRHPPSKFTPVTAFAPCAGQHIFILQPKSKPHHASPFLLSHRPPHASAYYAPLQQQNRSTLFVQLLSFLPMDQTPTSASLPVPTMLAPTTRHDPFRRLAPSTPLTRSAHTGTKTPSLR